MNPPEITDEMRAVMQEASALLASGKMMPDRIPPWWEPRREGELTPNYLGRVLDEVGLPDLARRAREGHFDDFAAPTEVADGFEMIRLVVELRRELESGTDPAGNPYRLETLRRRSVQIPVIENAVMRGEFDATKAESDRWAASKDGQETLGRLVGSVVAEPRERIGRNEPCPCGSGKKYKRCHGS